MKPEHAERMNELARMTPAEREAELVKEIFGPLLAAPTTEREKVDAQVIDNLINTVQELQDANRRLSVALSNVIAGSSGVPVTLFHEAAAALAASEAAAFRPEQDEAA